MAISIAPFIRIADKAGMPVKMLQLVEKNYKFEAGDGNETNPDTNTIYLTQANWDLIKSATVGKVFMDKKTGGPYLMASEYEAVAALYHEAAHAYADLKLGPRKPEGLKGTAYRPSSEYRFESATVKKVFTSAERYYQKAPLISDNQFVQQVRNEERAALEAVSMYVETRAGAFWRIVDELKGYLNKLDFGVSYEKFALTHAVKSVSDYQGAMADLVHGYDETPTFWGLGGKHYAVDKPISAGLKKFCDEDLLENKIPEKFHHSQRLEGLYAKIIDKVIRIQAKAAQGEAK